MGQQRAVEGYHFYVPVVQERGLMLCLLVRRVVYICDGDSYSLVQRMGDLFLPEPMVYSRMDAARADGAEFFSREGRRIGDKASLEQLIHNITGIPLTALRNEPLDQFSTSERVRWPI